MKERTATIGKASRFMDISPGGTDGQRARDTARPSCQCLGCVLGLCGGDFFGLGGRRPFVVDRCVAIEQCEHCL